MTEAEWLGSENPRQMLYTASRTASDRKFRLFTCACCRTIEKELPDEAIWLLDAVEAYLDGQLDWAGLNNVKAQARTPVMQGIGIPTAASEAAVKAVMALAWGTGARPFHGASDVLSGCFQARRQTAWRKANREFAGYFRDIVENPFRPVAFDPAWRTSTAVAVADGVYEERAFDRLPILADALQDAGCESDDVLSHCRGDGPHVRGCWVVDLVLNRE